MIWRFLFPLIFLYALVDGFISNVLYTEFMPLLYKDILILVIFLLFVIAENVRRTTGVIRASFGDAAWFLWVAFVFVAIGEIFNPYSQGLVIGLLGFKIYFLYCLLVPMAYAYTDSLERVVSLIKKVAYASIPINIFGLYQFVNGPDFLIARFGPGFKRAFFEAALEGSGAGANVKSFVRIIGTFASTGQYSSFLVLNAMLCLVLILQAKELRPRLFWSACSILNFMALLASGSRGFFVLLVASMGLFAVLSRQVRPVLIALVVSGISFYMGFHWLGKGVQARYQTLHETKIIHQRTVDIVGKMFIDTLDKFPLGKGLGSVSSAARHLSVATYKFSFVENYLAKLQLETGIGGVLVFYLFLIALLRRWWTKWIPAFNERTRAIGIPLSAYAIAYLLYGSVFSILDSPPGYLFFWMIVGIVLKIVDLSAEDAGEFPPV